MKALVDTYTPLVGLPDLTAITRAAMQEAVKEWSPPAPAPHGDMEGVVQAWRALLTLLASTMDRAGVVTCSAEDFCKRLEEGKNAAVLKVLNSVEYMRLA